MTIEIQEKDQASSKTDEILTKFYERHQHLHHSGDSLYNWKDMMQLQADERMLKKWKENNKAALTPVTMIKGVNDLNYDILYLIGAMTGHNKAQIAQHIDHEKNRFHKKIYLAHIFNKGSKLFFLIGLMYSTSLYLNTPWVEKLATFAFVLGLYCAGQTARWSAIYAGFKQQTRFLKSYATAVALKDIKLNMDKANLETIFDMNKYQVFSKVKNKHIIADYFIEDDDKSKSVNQAYRYLWVNAGFAFSLITQSFLFYFAPTIENGAYLNFSSILISLITGLFLCKALWHLHFSKLGG